MSSRFDRASAFAFAVRVVAISFVLHFAWEWVQCRPYFVHAAVAPTKAAMLVATLGDLGLTLLAYLGTAVATRAWDWPLRPWGWRTWLALEVSAIGWSLLVEWGALGTGRWSYTDAAPLLPGTSMSILPLLQLVLLFPASFGLARVAARYLGFGRFTLGAHR